MVYQYIAIWRHFCPTWTKVWLHYIVLTFYIKHEEKTEEKRILETIYHKYKVPFKRIFASTSLQLVLNSDAAHIIFEELPLHPSSSLSGHIHAILWKACLIQDPGLAFVMTVLF